MGIFIYLCVAWGIPIGLLSLVLYFFGDFFFGSESTWFLSLCGYGVGFLCSALLIWLHNNFGDDLLD